MNQTVIDWCNLKIDLNCSKIALIFALLSDYCRIKGVTVMGAVEQRARGELIAKAR